MDKRFRHIILMTTTALLTAACSSDPTSEPEPQPQEPVPVAVGFRGELSDAATRALGDGELTNPLLQQKGFGVYCWYTGTADFSTPAASTYMLMRNQKVEYVDPDGEGSDPGYWTYAPSKYWPLDPDEKLTFRAYAPYTDYLVENASGMPQLPVVVSNTDYHNGTQHDPLWGTGRLIDPSTNEYYAEGNTYGSLYDNYTYPMSGTYRLNAVTDPTEGTIHWYFHHGMAKLVFFAKLEDMGSDEEVYITNITIGPLYDKGLLNISSLAASSSDKPTWDVSEGGDMNVTLYGSDDTHSQDLDTYTIIKDTKDGLGNVTESGLRLLTPPGLLIIPRTYDSTTPLTISVSYKRALDDDNVFTVSTTIDSQTFVGNTVYTLNMNVSSALNVVIESVNAAFTSWSEKIKENYEVYNW